ncbi:ABC transporter substrate-binding protein [Pseudochrobactrum sp. HB0163]|uniref:ABC transporter substrate-binding protein n=1 Tax=Pseudochrobactrum sp. HB0163 TaxID=3450708 RepID=UPI003F6DB874
MTGFLLSRRSLLASTAALAAGAVLPRFSFAQSMEKTPSVEPARGGRLVVAADSEPANLNPAIIASNGVFYVASKVIEPLAEQVYADAQHPDGLKPLLATGWQGSEDGLSATFTLREGVKWHDGKPFTSADVAFSALEVWKPLQNLGRSVFKNLADVEMPDEHTAIFRFSEPTPFQLIRNALPIVTAVLPKHLYQGTDIAKNPANEKLVGTGPFIYGEHKPGEYYLLKRNNNYWNTREPALDEIIYQVLPDRAAAGNALEADQIQLAAFSAVPLANLGRIAKVPGLKVYTNGYEALTYQLCVEINHRRKELADLKVRQAIAHAIDKDFVVKTIFLGFARPATGLVPAFDKVFYAADTQQYPFDITKAEKLLDEAGYKRGGDGIRFRLKLLPAPFFNETRQFGDYLRQALAKIGIDAVIVANDTPAHLKAVYTDHDFDIAVATPVYRSDPAISTTVLLQGGLPAGVPFTNQYGYNNAAADALIAKGAVTLDDKARAAIYQDLQRLAAQDLPLINVADFSFITVASDKVQNVSDNPRWAVSNWGNTGIAG